MINPPPKYIAVNSKKGLKVIEVAKIIFLKASGGYTVISMKEHVDYTVSKNIGHYEKLFKDLDFLRVHNSYLINVAYLLNIEKDAGGQYCVLSENKMVPISNRRFTQVKKYLHY